MPRTAPPDPATPCIARHLIVYGRVQGVFYRQSMIDVATPLSLRGWVRNRSDGTVEALVQGPETAVQILIAWANQGPDRAQVERVVARDRPLTGNLGPAFERRATL